MFRKLSLPPQPGPDFFNFENGFNKAPEKIRADQTGGGDIEQAEQPTLSILCGKKLF